MKSHLFVAISLSVVLASRRPSSDHHDDTPPVSLRAILSPRTGTIAAPNQVIVQGGATRPHHNIVEGYDVCAVEVHDRQDYG
jgi:hypothetical protein